MLGFVLAMAMFFSNINYTNDFICVPERVFDYEFFLKTKKTSDDIDELCQKLDKVWSESESVYIKEKYNPNIINEEYCVLAALKWFHNFYLYSKEFGTDQLNIDPGEFYAICSIDLYDIKENLSVKRKCQEFLDK